MKLLKKLISCFTAGVAALSAAVCMTAGAGAAKEYSVNGYYDMSEGSYRIAVDGIPFDKIYLLPGDEMAVAVEFKSAGLMMTAMYVQDSKNEWDCAMEEKQKTVKEPVYGRDYDNTADGGDRGFVFAISADSKYVKKITACKQVRVAIFALHSSGGDAVQASVTPEGTEISGSKMYSVKPVWKTEKTDSSKKNAKRIGSAKFSAISDMAYTGKAVKPDIVIKDGSKTLKKGTDYTLSYKNNKKIGRATVVVTGKGGYTGTKALYFNIVPAATTVRVSKSGNTVKLSWREAKGAQKFEVYCSENGGKFRKLATVSSGQRYYKTTKLDKKSTYKFKVRSYAVSDGKKYYSAFSPEVKLS